MTRILAAALSSALLLASASAETLKDTLPHISVTGEASEEALPDRAILHLDIVVDRPTATEAVAENERKTRSLSEGLVRQGAPSDGIRVVGATLQSVATEDAAPRGAHGKRVSRGFRARSELSATVNSLDEAASLLSHAIDAGANDIRGVEFVFSDERTRLERLRIAAVKDAEQRARNYVEAVGGKLGRLIEIDRQEETVATAADGRTEPSASANGAASLPLRPGARRLTARVSATWALSR
ncbi:MULTISPECIES: SIMPL domain-containing protein [unclassified Methylosinus]|uniref:SIMPL domain-containing protein n=1 Tax=unclassified Methylosinus TaxID=2624500 RepID=UPI001379A450|nr:MULTISPECIES: SIMPL domain-containing protein [unclassified Methylosinus]MBU3890827.1 SIMPL domain-containing protein [Methylosinus sp. KRF6]